MKQGFTLIEVIAVLVLVTVLVLVSTLGFLPVVQGYRQVDANVASAQSAHLTWSRIARELTMATNVVGGASTSITYDFLDSQGQPHRHTLAWDGSAMLTINDAVLSDDVRDFQLRYRAGPEWPASSVWAEGDRVIDLSMTTHSTGDAYTDRIRPRNIGTRGL